MKEVLFASLEGNLTAINEFIPMVKLLESNGFSCKYLLTTHHQESIARLEQNNVNYKVLLKSKSGVVPQKSVREKLPAWLRNLALFYKTFKDIRKLIKATSGEFEGKEIHSIVLYGDRHLGVELALIYHAMKRKIKIIVPQVAINDIGFMVRLRFDNPNYHVGKGRYINNFIANKFSGLVTSHENKEFLFYTWGQVLALKILGLLPRSPWLIGNSFADEYLCVFNTYKDSAIAQGHLKDNIKVVGQLNFDQLFSHYQNRQLLKGELVAKYFKQTVNEETPVVVFALPQFFEHDLMTKEEALSEIGKVLDVLESNDVVVFISLHPKMKYTDYEYINANYKRIKVVEEERLSQVICVSDIFVSCFASTIPWAVLVNASPVFLDLYNLKFDLSVFSETKIVQSLDELNKFLNHYDLHQNMEVSSSDSRYIPLDGKCETRILESFNFRGA